jgi:hypothetical protein
MIGGGFEVGGTVDLEAANLGKEFGCLEAEGLGVDEAEGSGDVMASEWTVSLLEMDFGAVEGCSGNVNPSDGPLDIVVTLCVGGLHSVRLARSIVMASSFHAIAPPGHLSRRSRSGQSSGVATITSTPGTVPSSESHAV